MKKTRAAFVLLLALGACADQPPPPAPVSHALPPRIRFDVQAINLADRSGLQPLSSPYNDNHFSPTIAEAIRQWAGDRLQAAGQSGQAIIIVKDASLMAQQLPVEQGADGWFTRQQGSKYIGRAEVSIEANGPQGFATADATATRSVTLPEDPTAAEKQNAYFTLLDGLMKDLGENLEAGIRAHMNAFILPSPVYGGTATPLSEIPQGEVISPTVIEGEAPAPQVPIAAPPQAQAAASYAQPRILSAPVTATQVSPPVMTISQSQAPMQAQSAPQPLGPAPLPQAPVFRAAPVPIPNTASMPSSFAGTPRTMPQTGAVGIAMPPSPAPAAYDGNRVASAAPNIAPMPPMEPIPPPSPDALAQMGQPQPSPQAVTIPLSRGPYAQP